MDRRRFLASLLAAAPAMVLDPERLLWVPGQKTYFLPAIVPATSSVVFGVDCQFDSVELTLSIDEFVARILGAEPLRSSPVRGAIGRLRLLGAA